MSLRFLAPIGLLLFACDTAESPCAPGQIETVSGCGFPPAPVLVHVSSVGFRAERAKRATYAGGPAEGLAFQVRRTEDDAEVLSGRAGPAINASDSGEQAHVVDFSELTEPGSYYLAVDDIGESVEFRVADDVYVEPYVATMVGLYGQRCGSAVAFDWQGTSFQHGECHAADGAPLGWHDAGDYGKYTNNGGFSLGMLLFAWQHYADKLAAIELDIPERGGDIPDFLDECRFQLEWLLGMQQQDTGGVHDRVTTAQFDAMGVMPERSVNPRKMSPVSTTATADFVAVVARASRALEPYDPEMAERARTAALAGWQFLLDNPDNIPVVTMGYTGSYASGDPDDRAWAAAEVFETTGDTTALSLFEAAVKRPGFNTSPAWDWADLNSLGAFTYIESEREGRDPAVLNQLSIKLILSADAMMNNAETHAYGRSLAGYYDWGVNGSIARTVMGLMVAKRIADRDDSDDFKNGDRYLDTASFQLDHLFGRNYYGRSFLTGVGHNPPNSPHHRPSVADGISPPWPGLLVGGPSSAEGGPIATQWYDDAADFRSNEVAINWNAALTYALAAFLP
jgi:endoglucanase